ncbi:MAG: hypothetical protein QOK05_1760 [Chloroflexota bacterium]|jgi:hypothetical protein|nr:hypothetical protein [Chloroflexota bacterium]
MTDSPPIDHPATDYHVRGSERPYKAGHPRFNVAVLLVLVLALLVFALIQAQRLAF